MRHNHLTGPTAVNNEYDLTCRQQQKINERIFVNCETRTTIFLITITTDTEFNQYHNQQQQPEYLSTGIVKRLQLLSSNSSNKLQSKLEE